MMTSHTFFQFYQVHPSIAVLGGVTLVCLVLLSIHFFTSASTKPVDVTDIAGDDVSSSQLDLAQAYLEMDNRDQAKPLLQQVMQQGSSAQQAIARKLLASCG